MRLAAVLAELLQLGASSLTEPDRGPGGLVGVLANRLGGSKVYRIAAVESDGPKRSVWRAGATSAPSGRTWFAHWSRP